jgi:hypothetical protein
MKEGRVSANDNEMGELFAKLSAMIDGGHWTNADVCARIQAGRKRAP